MTKHFLITSASLLGAFALFTGSSAADDPLNAAAISQLHIDSPMSWSNAGPNQFQTLLNGAFSVKNADNQTANLKLIDVVPGPEDTERPPYLPREQAVTIVFETTDSNIGWLEETGSHVVDIWHHELGNQSLLMTVTPRQHGGHSIEVSFN